MRIHTVAESAGLCHEVGRAVTGGAISVVGGRHGTGVFFVALVAGEVRWHVWSVNILSLVAGEAFLIHGTRLDGAALEDLGGAESGLRGGPCLAMP